MPHFFALILMFSLNYKQSSPYQFLEKDELNHHIRRIRADQKQLCNEDKLVNFLAEIQVINPESIMKLATLKELQSTCDKVSGNLQKMNDYLKTCKPADQPNLYVQLIKGVESLHDKICTESGFKQRFESIHKCLNELKGDFDSCGGPADWNENSDDREICKAYKEIADCYYVKSAKVCGKSAAATVKELLNAIINSIITVKCNVNDSPEVKDAMPETYLGRLSKGNFVTKPTEILIGFQLLLCIIQ